MPKYSIIIPTRNRAHLLEYAIQCALGQTLDDYEIVISNNHSADQTARVVERFNHPRIRYFSTPETYSMPDSWEFALSKSTGEWMTFLTDDSGISSRLLAEVDAALSDNAVQAVSWSHLGKYYHKTWDCEAEQNRLVYYSFGGGRRLFDAASQLAKLFHLAADYTHPVGLNSFCRRDAVNRVQQCAGRFFFLPCPDYSSCAALLSVIDRYLYIDLPLGINGIGRESIGTAQVTKRGESADNFVKEFKDEPILANVPLSTTVVANYIAESLLRVKKALPREFRSIDLDWGAYFFHCLIQLGYLEKNRVDVGSEKSELFSVLQKQPPAIRAAFRKYLIVHQAGLSDSIGKFRNAVRGFIRRAPFFHSLERKVRRMPIYGGTISGQKAGFSNLYEAVRYLDLQVMQ